MTKSEQSESPAGIQFYGGYQVYSDTGVDLTLLRRNLGRSVDQRWVDNTRGIALAQAFENSGRRRFGFLPKPKGDHAVFDPASMLRQLCAANINFVVVGGLAMRTTGSALLTDDLDILYQRDAKNIDAMATALAPLHPYLRGAPPGLPFRLDAETIGAGLNFTLDTDLGPFDILGEVSGVGNYEKALSVSEEHEIFGLKVRVLSLDGLIAAKKAAGRRKDRDHLLELEELKKLRDSGSQGGDYGQN